MANGEFKMKLFQLMNEDENNDVQIKDPRASQAMKVAQVQHAGKADNEVAAFVALMQAEQDSDAKGINDNLDTNAEQTAEIEQIKDRLDNLETSLPTESIDESLEEYMFKEKLATLKKMLAQGGHDDEVNKEIQRLLVMFNATAKEMGLGDHQHVNKYGIDPNDMANTTGYVDLSYMNEAFSETVSPETVLAHINTLQSMIKMGGYDEETINNANRMLATFTAKAEKMGIEIPAGDSNQYVDHSHDGLEVIEDDESPRSTDSIGGKFRAAVETLAANTAGTVEEDSRMDPQRRESTVIDYRDPEGRFVVYYVYEKRGYVAAGRGVHQGDIAKNVFKTGDEAREHAEMELTDDIDEESAGPIKKAVRKGKKWLKRGLTAWDDDYNDPKDMQDRAANYSDDELKNLADFHDGMGSKDRKMGKASTPASFQQKLIKRQMRKRGQRDFEKYMPEEANGPTEESIGAKFRAAVETLAANKEVTGDVNINSKPDAGGLSEDLKAMVNLAGIKK